MRTCNAITLDQLLTLRDGEPLDVVVATFVLRHLDECPSCQQELERLHSVRASLRELPLLAAPPRTSKTDRHLWRDAIDIRTVRNTTVGISIGAAAAGLVAVVALLMDQSRLPTESLVPANQSIASLDDSKPGRSPDTAQPWAIRSTQLESLLRELPQRPVVQRISTSATIDALEHRIQWVDYQITVANEVGLSEDQFERLWRDRVQLLDTLVKVRSAEIHRLAAIQ